MAEANKKKAVKRITSKRLTDASKKLLITGMALMVLLVFLIPMGYGIVTAVKTDGQFSKVGAPWWPASEGQLLFEEKEYDMFLVPLEDGDIPISLALYKKGRTVSQFVDPNNIEAGPFEWEGNWRGLERDWAYDPQWQNFSEAWETIDFPLLLRNTFLYAVITTFGAVLSASLVGFGFARFRIPFKNVMFLLMLSTVILPNAVTLIPTYYLFLRLGWVGTWLPLVIPTFFSWGTNVFLMRQFFMSIPRELDDAAMIDGANPFQVFWKIIMPQSIPALTAVALFHFFYAWNDFFGPLIYLAGNPEKFPITVGLTAFNNLYSQSTNLIQAASIISVIIPLIVFIFAQRFFMQGIVITGVEK